MDREFPMGHGSNSSSRPIGSRHSQHRRIHPTSPNRAAIVVSGASTRFIPRRSATPVVDWKESGAQLSRRGSDLDGESKVLQTVDEAQNLLALGAVVEVVCAEVRVEGAAIWRAGSRSANRIQRFLWRESGRRP